MEQREAEAADGFGIVSVDCQHHWIIDAPSGPTSLGVCRKCGDEREFRNSLPDPPRDDDAFSHFYGKNSVVPRGRAWDVERDPSYSVESYD